MTIQTQKKCGTVRVRVVQGDITQLGEHQDCLVSSDDNYLTHGGGVSRALWRGAGPAIEPEARKHVGGLRLGDVVRTGAGDLNAAHLLHAITIDFDTRQLLGRAEARDLFAEVLATARRLGCTSLATPLLGTGAGDLNAQDFMDVALDALVDFLDSPGTLREVNFVEIKSRNPIAKSAVEERLASWVSIQSLLDDALHAVPPGVEVDAIKSLTSVDIAEHPMALIDAFEAAIDLLIRVQGPGSNLQEKPSRMHAPLGERIGQLLRMRTEAGRPIPRESAATLEAFLRERNRLAHGMGSAPNATRMGLLWRGIRDALSLLAAETPPIAQSRKGAAIRSGKPAQSHGIVSEPSIVSEPRLMARFAEPDQGLPRVKLPEPPQPPPQEKPRGEEAPRREKTLPAGGEASGTQPVRRLHEFLEATLGEEERRHILEQLRAEGYKGSDSNQLLEYCVRVPDPADIFIAYYTVPGLRGKIKSQGYKEAPPATSMGELIKHLLREMGFPGTDEAVSLQAQIEEIQAARSHVNSGNAAELDGIVIRAATRLEHCLKILIHALANAAFRMRAEDLVGERKWIESSRDLERASLGTLIDIVWKIDAAFRAGEGDQAFREDFKVDHLFTDDIRKRCQEIPAIRNGFGHHQENSQVLPEDKKKRALRFFNKAIDLLECLRDREPTPDTKLSLFPIVIKVVSLQFDAYGRKTVTAFTDGSIKETLFTDVDIKPGQIYFMYPLTNPHRIDPILHEAGHLGRMMGMD